MKFIRAILFGFLAFCASANAADCSSVTCKMLIQPPSTAATILLNQSWDATGVGAGHTTYCCATVIEPASYNNALILLHGGGGDEFDVCRQFEFCTLATQSFPITNATWTSTYGGSTTYTVSSDPSSYVTEGNVISVANTQATGGTGAGYNGNGLTVLAVTSNSITVSQISAGSPGTFTACGGGGQPTCGTATALTITPNSVIYAYINFFKTMVILPQGLPPLGGTDAGNTPSFSGTITGNSLNAGAPSVGVIALPQVISGTGVTGTPTITAHGTGTGYAGTYTFNGPSLGSIGPETMTANGCPVAPNTQTWSNGNTTSCRDDSTALDALATGAQTTFSLTAAVTDCLGHSEGAGMCLRLLWEHGSDFGHFGAVSMPFSLYFDAAGGGHTTPPAVKRPIWWMVGGQDNVVCVYVIGNCGGVANTFHATISGTALTVQSVQSGAVTAGNTIMTGATVGTYISSCSDSTHCTVTPSQTVSSSTAMQSNNLFSTQIQNNSDNLTPASFPYPGSTVWPGYANSVATWVNAYSLHGCPGGLGSQMVPSDAVVSAIAVSYLMKWDYCSGYIEYNQVAAAAHDTKSITTDLGSGAGDPPAVRFLLWAVAHPIP